MRFGMIRWRRSMMARATISPRNGVIMAAAQIESNSRAAPTNRIPVRSSVRGYTSEIRAPHARHRPRRSTQDSRGMLSRFRSWAPQDGQRDLGATMDSPLGTRCVTTVRKLPKARPTSPNNAARRAITRASCQRRQEPAPGDGTGSAPDLGDLLPQDLLQAPTEADDGGDPVVVVDPETVGDIHRPGVQGAVGRVGLLLESHLPRRVQHRRDGVVRIVHVAGVEDDGVLAVDATVASVHRARR